MITRVLELKVNRYARARRGTRGTPRGSTLGRTICEPKPLEPLYFGQNTFEAVVITRTSEFEVETSLHLERQQFVYWLALPQTPEKKDGVFNSTKGVLEP
jgi:hypothetical protein